MQDYLFVAHAVPGTHTTAGTVTAVVLSYSFLAAYTSGVKAVESLFGWVFGSEYVHADVLPIRGGQWCDPMNSCFYTVIDHVHGYDICQEAGEDTESGKFAIKVN